MKTMRVLALYCVLYSILVKQLSARVSGGSYNLERQRILAEEDNLAVGNEIRLTEDEKRANEILMHWKNKEIDASMKNGSIFNFSKHFFTYKNEIHKSKVYQIIKKMPKGAALHIHASMMLDADSLLELTYEDYLYACYIDDGLKLQFSDTVPFQSCPSKWDLLSELRNASDDVNQFDIELRKHFTLYTEDESVFNADINYTWERFNKVYRTIKSFINYRPIREKAFYKALEHFYNDNVMYVEIRSGLHAIHELDGSVCNEMELAELYQRITNKFIEDHPDFIGVKLILTTGRWLSKDIVQKSLNKVQKLKKELPDLIAGFDLIGQEDIGQPLTEFFSVLNSAKDDVDYYFHAGETNWFGTASDENLIDAVLLGSKRIGHAYALLKHPKLLAIAKQKDIALEINVISNQVLSLVHDIRNHPLATYLALGYPVVLSSDDPGVWEADPLSHDFYVAFVGVASRHADLRLLKQLSLNSIRYSSLDNISKDNFYTLFNKKWDNFVQSIIDDKDLSDTVY